MDKANWLIKNNRIVLRINKEELLTEAKYIVQAEYKDERYINGIEIKKPSESLSHIKFNRFPLECFLKLTRSVDNLQHTLRFGVRSNSDEYFLENLIKDDQILIDDKWFPLVIENIKQIICLLKEHNIVKLGEINLKQYLGLVTSGSEFLIISEEGNQDKNQSDVKLDDLLNELSTHGFNAQLYDYQKSGVNWLYGIVSEHIGCILADEMGLGKTIQIIGLHLLCYHEYKLPTLVIGPATLLENWRREISKFTTDVKVNIHSGHERTGFPSKLQEYDIIVTSYDIVARDLSMLNMVRWGLVIVDEAQAIKNPHTRRSKSIKELNKLVGIAVTGTPIENKLLDLWSIMDFTCKGLLGTQKQFEETYIDNEKSASNLESIISPLILRRRVKEVANDLPSKIIIPQAIEMTEYSIDLYDKYRNSIIDEYGESASLVSLIKLRQFCAHPSIVINDLDIHNNPEMNSNKYQRLIEILDEIIQKSQKVLIFTSFVRMSDIIANDFTNRFMIPTMQIDGRTEINDRQKIVDTFSEIKGSAILVLNPRAAGTGLNITEANHVIHYNLEWNPAIEDQSTARAYRRGQSLPVTVHRLFYSDTIEDIINVRLERKRNLAETAIVGTSNKEIDKSDIISALRLSPKKI